jgi:hypothetical protein
MKIRSAALSYCTWRMDGQIRHSDTATFISELKKSFPCGSTKKKGNGRINVKRKDVFKFFDFLFSSLASIASIVVTNSFSGLGCNFGKWNELTSKCCT